MDKPQYLIDEPATEDSFEGSAHLRTAEMLCDIIIADDPNMVRAIGIEGKWGSGKSSLINLLIKEIKKKKPKTKVLDFVFDLWEHQSDVLRKAFVIEFLDKIKNTAGISEKIIMGWNKDANILSGQVEHRTIETRSSLPFRSRVFAVLTIYTLPISLILMGPWYAKHYILGLEFYLIGITIFMLPFLLLFGLYLWWRPTWKFYSVEFWRSLSSFRWFSEHREINKNDSLLALVANKADINISSEKKQLDQPELLEFKSLLEKMLLALADKKCNVILIFDNLDRASVDCLPNLWAFIQSIISVIGSSRAGSKLCWVLIPYDRDTVKLCHKNNADSSVSTEEILSKTLDIIIPVPPLLLSDWKIFFKEKCQAAGLSFKNELDRLEAERVIELYFADRAEKRVVPRELLRIINAVVSAYLRTEGKYPLPIYFAYSTFADPSISGTKIGGASIPEAVQNLLFRYSWQKYFAAIEYGVDEDRALHVLMDSPIRSALFSFDRENLEELSKVHGFNDVLNAVVISLGGISAKLGEKELGNVVSSLIWLFKKETVNPSLNSDVATLLCRSEEWREFNVKLYEGFEFVVAAPELLSEMLDKHGLIQSISRIRDTQEWSIDGACMWAKSVILLAQKIDDLSTVRTATNHVRGKDLSGSPKFILGILAANGEANYHNKTLWGDLVTQDNHELLIDSLKQAPYKKVAAIARAMRNFNRSMSEPALINKLPEIIEHGASDGNSDAYSVVQALIETINEPGSAPEGSMDALSKAVNSGAVQKILGVCSEGEPEVIGVLVAAILLRFKNEKSSVTSGSENQDSLNKGIGVYEAFLRNDLGDDVVRSVIRNLSNRFTLSQLVHDFSVEGELKDCVPKILQIAINNRLFNRLNYKQVIHDFDRWEELLSNADLKKFLIRFDAWIEPIFPENEEFSIVNCNKRFLAKTMEERTKIGKKLGEIFEKHIKSLEPEAVLNIVIDKEWFDVFIRMYSSNGVKPKIYREIETALLSGFQAFITEGAHSDNLDKMIELTKVLPGGTRVAVMKSIRDMTVDSRHPLERTIAIIEKIEEEYFSISSIEDRAKDFARVVIVGLIRTDREKLKAWLTVKSEVMDRIGKKLDKETREYITEQLEDDADGDLNKHLHARRLIIK